jgi:hypothetical protein
MLPKKPSFYCASSTQEWIDNYFSGSLINDLRTPEPLTQEPLTLREIFNPFLPGHFICTKSVVFESLTKNKQMLPIRQYLLVLVKQFRNH